MKELKKLNPDLIPDKRKRDEVYKAIMVRVLKSKLAQYPTSAEQDEELLRKQDIAKRHRMAIEVRLGEKRLIEEGIALIGNAEEEFSEPHGERAAKRVKK